MKSYVLVDENDIITNIIVFNNDEEAQKNKAKLYYWEAEIGKKYNYPGISFLKQELIKQSKEQLSIFLEQNPIEWKDGRNYTITAEKQNQLTSKIMAATLAKQVGQEYDLTWNSTGDICKTWTLEELSELAFAIDARVTKLVEYQQQKEIDINNCQTEEELSSIVIDYNSVS